MAETQTGTGEDSGNEQLIALILSFFIPGLGQLYQGRTKEGGLFLGIVVVLFIITLATAGLGTLITAPIGFINWIVNLYDVWTEWLDL